MDQEPEKEDSSPVKGSPAAFRTTQWKLLREAADSQAPGF